MRALREIYVLCLVAAVGCDGPRLNAGVHLPELDSGEASDARVRDGDAGRPRDAQLSDADGRFPWGPEAHRCNKPQQCFDNEHNQICHPEWGICVECFRDEDCPDRRCNDELGQCREPDKPRP
jgi:hypothetical protein